MAPPDDYPDDKVFISDQSLRVFTKRDILKIYDKFQKPGGAVSMIFSRPPATWMGRR